MQLAANKSVWSNETVRYLVVTLAICALSSCQQTEPLPPLLVNAKAGGGWASMCPPANDAERQTRIAVGKVAISPDIESRLQHQFPPGSPGAALTAELKAEGFKLLPPCAGDASIQSASYYRKGVGLLPYDTSATIFWKLDDAQRIEWATGMVFYRGL